MFRKVELLLDFFFISWSALLQHFFLVWFWSTEMLHCPMLYGSTLICIDPLVFFLAFWEPPSIKIAQQYQSMSKQHSKSNVPWSRALSTSSFVQQDHSISQPQLTLCVFEYVCVSNIMCVNLQTPIFQGFFLTSKTIEADEWWLCQALKSLQGLVCVMCLPVAYGVCVFMREWQLTVKPWPVFLVLCAIKHRLAFRKPGNQCVSATSLTHGICSHPTHLFIIFLWGLATLQGKKKHEKDRQRGGEGIQDAIPNISKQYPEKNWNDVFL